MASFAGSRRELRLWCMLVGDYLGSLWFAVVGLGKGMLFIHS